MARRRHSSRKGNEHENSPTQRVHRILRSEDTTLGAKKRSTTMTMKATTIHRRRMHVVRGLIPLVALVVAVGATRPTYAVDTVTSFAPSTNTCPGVWFESDVRQGGTASIVDLTGLGGDLENNQPLPTGAAKLHHDTWQPPGQGRGRRAERLRPTQ